MKSSTILALQAVLQFLQIVNAGLASLHPPAWVSLVAAAGLASVSGYLQNLGNTTLPPAAVAVLDEGQKKTLTDQGISVPAPKP